MLLYTGLLYIHSISFSNQSFITFLILSTILLYCYITQSFVEPGNNSKNEDIKRLEVIIACYTMLYTCLYPEYIIRWFNWFFFGLLTPLNILFTNLYILETLLILSIAFENI